VSNCASSPSIRGIPARLHVIAARGCDTRARLISGGATHAEFDYVGSLTVHAAPMYSGGGSGGLTASCIRFSRERK